jgi:hypothetical protein
MASYALLLALSGFFYSAPEQLLRFVPRIYEDDFSCFFSVGSGWGSLRQVAGQGTRRVAVEVYAGELVLSQVAVGFAMSEPRITLAGEPVARERLRVVDGTRLQFAEPVTIRAGESLVIDVFEG